jgi:predicted ArsR family transcriptional regulator
VLEAVADAAAAAGRRLATPASTLPDVLTGLGYEPREEGDGVVLGNCPFHRLASTHTALVCGLNLGLLSALLDERGSAAQALLDPAPGRCCVVLAAASDRGQ